MLAATSGLEVAGARRFAVRGIFVLSGPRIDGVIELVSLPVGMGSRHKHLFGNHPPGSVLCHLLLHRRRLLHVGLWNHSLPGDLDNLVLHPGLRDKLCPLLHPLDRLIDDTLLLDGLGDCLLGGDDHSLGPLDGCGHKLYLRERGQLVFVRCSQLLDRHSLEFDLGLGHGMIDVFCALDHHVFVILVDVTVDVIMLDRDRWIFLLLWASACA